MLDNESLKNWKSSITAAFLLSGALICGGCDDPQKAREYVQEKSADFKPEIPAQISPTSQTGKTLAYWQKAISEVTLCRELTPDDELSNDKLITGARYVGMAVTQDLRDMPVDGVDPEAVRSIQMVADGFDDLRKLEKIADKDAGDIGAAIGGALARGAAGSTSSAGEGIAAAGDDIAAEMALSHTAKTVLDNTDLIGLGGASGWVKAGHAITKLEDNINARLERSRRALEEKYDVHFPEFSIVSKNSQTIVVAGCRATPP